MAIFSVLLILLSPILLLAAVAVRFAGNRHVLNTIDYRNIADKPRLHRWSGNRLLLLPVVSLSFGIASIQRPGLSIIGGGILALAGILVIGWIMAGSEKFRSR